jgi:transposase
MPKPYSLDLRDRVLKCFKENVLHKDIASKLDISIRTVGRYYKKYKQIGNIEIKKEVKIGRKEKIKDLEKLKVFVKENNKLSLINMAKKLGSV